MEKAKWLPLKKMLFMYLAISKAWYWFDVIVATNLDNLGMGGVGRLIMMRLLERDILIIGTVIAFFFLDKLIDLKKSKYSKVLEELLFFGIGYVVFIGMVFIYYLALNFFLEENVVFFGSALVYFTVGYIIVAAIMHLKYYFKSKEKSVYVASASSTEDQLSMLQTLLNDGILSQEEFDQKKLLCK